LELASLNFINNYYDGFLESKIYENKLENELVASDDKQKHKYDFTFLK